MSQVAVSLINAAVVGATLLVAGSQVLAQSRAEVLERIAPVGTVAIEGQAAAAQPAAPVAETMASNAPATMPEAESAPAPAPAAVAEPTMESAPVAEPVVASAPVAAPAGGGAGAELYVAKTCVACHGADARSPIMPTYPRLAGQNAQYLVQQLSDIKSGVRDHGQTMLMRGIMANVSDDEIKAIADWLSTL